MFASCILFLILWPWSKQIPTFWALFDYLSRECFLALWGVFACLWWSKKSWFIFYLFIGKNKTELVPYVRCFKSSNLNICDKTKRKIPPTGVETLRYSLRWSPPAGWWPSVRPRRLASWPRLRLAPSWSARPRSSREPSSRRPTRPSAAPTWPAASPRSPPPLWGRERAREWVTVAPFVLRHSLLRPFKLPSCCLSENRCISSKI